MALGMTKDSMVDLQSLVQEKSDSRPDSEVDTVSLLTTGQSRGSQLQYDKLAVPLEPQESMDEEEKKLLSSPELQKANIPQSSGSVTSTDQAGREEQSHTTGGKPAKSPLEAFGVEEEKKQEPADSYGQYSGFQNDYEAYNYDAYHFQYHQQPQTILGGKKQSSGGFLCCLFPWLNFARVQPMIDNTPANPELDAPREEAVTSPKEGALRRSSSLGEDDESVGSDRLGERLSNKDRQAVLARLRLAQPDQPLNSPSQSPDTPNSPEGTDGSVADNKIQNKNSLLNEIPNLPLQDDSNADDAKSDAGSCSSVGRKGILKRTSVIVKRESQVSDGNKSRRSLFPTYGSVAPKKKNRNKLQFAPMARVVTVKSQKDMTPEEKSAIWWQRWDYEDFRKTGRIITRAMLEGGSEIWLASNQSWQHQGASKTATLKNAMTLSERSAKNGTSNGKNETADLIRTTGDKWWHMFGHSRRGLEHIASMKEGSERQANVRHAIRAVLDEQRRQKAYMREDPDKLRMVSLHNTSWARDLACAAGSSDADAVKSNFDEERKSREFYLLKMARSNAIVSKGKQVPAFMQPAMNTFAPKLDANTSAQIMYRRKQQKQQLLQKESMDSSGSNGVKNRRGSAPSLSNKSTEPIHDPQPAETGHLDLAKRAAGFSHDGAEQVNMAAVLSGMGAVPKIAQPV